MNARFGENFKTLELARLTGCARSDTIAGKTMQGILERENYEVANP